MMIDTGGVVGITIGMATLAIIVSVMVCLGVVFFVIKPDYVQRTNDLDAKLKSTIYDVNVQNAASKELEDEQAWYAKNVLLTRIQNIEAKISSHS
jgi:uncharacterized membrane protein YhiD involved in acid resistance